MRHNHKYSQGIANWQITVFGNLHEKRVLVDVLPSHCI